MNEEKKNITIRSATVEDTESIFHLICDLEDQQMDRESFFRNYLENLNRPDIYYLVAATNGTVVGFTSLHLQHILHHSQATGEVQELIIDPEYRDSGIGSLLMNELEQIASNLHLEEIELTTRLYREKAQLFYKQRGYTNTHLKFVKRLSM